MRLSSDGSRIAVSQNFGPIDVLAVGVLAAGPCASPTQRAGSPYAVASAAGNNSYSYIEFHQFIDVNWNRNSIQNQFFSHFFIQFVLTQCRSDILFLRGAGHASPAK